MHCNWFRRDCQSSADDSRSGICGCQTANWSTYKEQDHKPASKSVTCEKFSIIRGCPRLSLGLSQGHAARPCKTGWLTLLGTHGGNGIAREGAAPDVISQVMVRDDTKDLSLPCLLEERPAAMHCFAGSSGACCASRVACLRICLSASARPFLIHGPPPPPPQPQ